MPSVIRSRCRRWLRLRWLDLAHNQLGDLEPLRTQPHLRVLSLRGKLVHDLRPLQSLPHLQSLDLQGNQVNDVSALQSMTSLRTVDLRKNKITQILPVHLPPRMDMEDGPEEPWESCAGSRMWRDNPME